MIWDEDDLFIENKDEVREPSDDYFLDETK